MREVTTHKVNGLNESIIIHACDDRGERASLQRLLAEIPVEDILDRSSLESRLEMVEQELRGEGGASHIYSLKLPGNRGTHNLFFQRGAIKENGVNGITNEALLAIVADRLEGFQSGQFACEANAIALSKIREAIEALHGRTRERLARGVEGTHAV